MQSALEAHKHILNPEQKGTSEKSSQKKWHLYEEPKISMIQLGVKKESGQMITHKESQFEEVGDQTSYKVY